MASDVARHWIIVDGCGVCLRCDGKRMGQAWPALGWMLLSAVVVMAIAGY